MTAIAAISTARAPAPAGLPTGFRTFADLTPKRTLIVMSYGMDGTGKTDHALRTGPEPVFHIITDPNAEAVHKRVARETGREMHYFMLDYNRADVPGLRGKADAEVKASWQADWKKFTDAYRSALSLRQGTLVIDTATEEYELQRLAEFGRISQRGQNYGPINREQKDLMRAAYESDLNVIFVHKMRKVYKGEGDNASWTGEWEPACWSDMRFEVEVRLRHTFEGGSFYVEVEKHNKAYELVGVKERVIEAKFGFGDLIDLTFPE